MSLISNLFKRKNHSASEGFINPIQTELHSHIIPGIDDGSSSFEESLEMLKGLKKLGYNKVITTPHIMGDYYKNSIKTIQPVYEKLVSSSEFKEIGIQLSFSAEYMVDETLEDKIEKNELLPFGDNYILVELPFIEEPPIFRKVLFQLQLAGFQPVLAHPERYPYYGVNRKLYDEIFESGILFQVNIMSLSGYYAPAIRENAAYLIEKKMVNFVGSDLHHPGQLHVLENSINTALFEKMCRLNLLNNTL